MQFIWITDVILMIFWTNHHNMGQKIWFYKKIVGHGWSKTVFQLIIYKLAMELLQVHMGNYHFKIHFHVVKYQMSHYYLCSKSKTYMKKWYFEYFIAVYFLSLFNDHTVYTLLTFTGSQLTAALIQPHTGHCITQSPYSTHSCTHQRGKI